MPGLLSTALDASAPDAPAPGSAPALHPEAHIHVRRPVGRRDYLEMAARTGHHPVPADLLPRAGWFWRCLTCRGFGGSVLGTVYSS